MIKVILPAYNEEKALPSIFNFFIGVLEKGIQQDFKIFLINDGSRDHTEEVARGFLDKLPLSIISHKENMGLGLAIKTGFEAAAKEYNEQDIIVVLDADNTHSPGIINIMADKIGEGYDIVIASRYNKEGREIGLSFYRRLTSKIANLLLKAFFPIDGVKDYTCGFRAYGSSIIKKGLDKYGENFIREKGFVCMAEILLKLNSLGAKTSEVPLVLRYDLKTGKSKMKILKTIAGYLSLIARGRSSSF